SDRLFCEMLDYNLLFRWFLDMDMEGRSFDHSTFSKNRERLIEHDIAKRFFAGVITEARSQTLLSDEHFTVDGTLIEAWALDQEFEAEGRSATTEGWGWQRNDGLPRREAQQRHACLEHRSGSEIDAQGQWPAGEAELWRARADGE